MELVTEVAAVEGGTTLHVVTATGINGPALVGHLEESEGGHCWKSYKLVGWREDGPVMEYVQASMTYGSAMAALETALAAAES